MKKFIILLTFTLIIQGVFAMENILTPKEIAITDLAAAVARGDQTALAGALNRGFDAGITINEAKEYVGQLYA